jgi:hypothetical protein
MLQYLYSFDYDDEDVDEHGSISRLPFNIRVFALAQRYDIEPLMIHAVSRFAKLTEDEPSGDGFSCAMKLLYENTLDIGVQKEKLKKAAMEYATVRYEELVQEDGGFKEGLAAVNGFGADVTEALSLDEGKTKLRKANVKRYKCPNNDCAEILIAEIPENPTPENFSCPFCRSSYEVVYWTSNIQT